MKTFNPFYFLFSLLFIFTCSDLSAQENTLKGSALFGNMRARHIGPAVMSGRVTDVVGVEKDPKIIYVASAGGGIWKSTNGGATFNPIFEKYAQSIGKIAIDQKHPDTLWAGTGEVWVRNSTSVGTGLYKSTNGGKDWELKGLPDSERIADIIIDPANPNTVYVAVLGHLWDANENRGLYKTTDGGSTWEKILYVDANTGCSDISMDASNPNILYASMWEFRRYAYFFNSGGKGSGLFKSIDGGKTWNKIHNGLPQTELGRIAIESAPSKPEVLYATVEAKSKEEKGLYKSIDGGNSWTKTGNDFNLYVRPFYFSRLTVDPKNDSVVYKMGLSMVVSKDGGKTFRAAGAGVHSDWHAIWINPKNTEMSYVGTDGGVYRSLDNAYTYEMMGNLPLSQFYQVSYDQEEPYNVYGGLQDNGSWYGPSNSPGGVQNKDWVSIGYGDGFQVYPHPINKDVIFWEYQGGNLARYSKTTGQNKDIKPYKQKDEPKLRFNWNSPIHMSPNNPNRMYYGAQFLYVSEDMGDTWKRISDDLTTNDPNKLQQEKSGGLSIDNSAAENHCTIFAIAESPKNEAYIWVGTDDGNLQLTTDGGKKWTNLIANVTGLPKNTWVTHIEPSRFDLNTVYVTFDGHTQGDKKSYVYKSSDLGKTWQNLATADITGYAHCIREDYKNQNLLFLGTEFGLFISIDGGKNWSAFTNNVPPVSVRHLVLHASKDDLILATHGRGIMIIDDISPLRQISPEVIAKDVHFFESKPAYLGFNGGAGQSFGGVEEFAGENSNENAQIVYYLKKRHTFGDMYLEVFDESGKLISKLPAGKSAGINKVEWATRLKRPKTAIGTTLAVGGLFGPTLPEGKYQVKMTKGKDSYTTEIVLAADPKSPYTAEDRKLQQSTAMQLYNMTEELAYIAECVQSMKKESDDRAKQNPKLAKSLGAFSKELEDFNKTLVVTTGDNYVETASDQLREKISNLYAAVLQYGGRPSNSHLDNLKVLDAELKVAAAKLEEIKSKKLPGINAQLLKAELQEIKLPTFEEFKAKE